MLLETHPAVTEACVFAIPDPTPASALAQRSVLKMV
jgi:hypothetical protein